MSKRISLTAKAQTIAPIETRDQATAAVQVIISAQLANEKAIAARDEAVSRISETYTREITANTELMTREMERIKAWADAHPSEFGKAESILLDGHRVGYRKGNHETKLKSGWTWKRFTEAVSKALPSEFLKVSDLQSKLQDQGVQDDSGANALKVELQVQQERADQLARFTRIKIEPDKEELISIRDSHADLLSEFGVKITQQTTFYLKPAREGQDGPELTC